MTGDELRRIRLQRDMTQEQFADQMGVTSRQLRRYESSAGDIPKRITGTVQMIEKTVPVIDEKRYQQIRQQRYGWRKKKPPND